MKSPEEWASLYFTDKVRLLPDIIKQVQDETCEEVVNAVLQAVNGLKQNKKEHGINTVIE
ncbi:MAG: hypothetical protein KBD57_09330 [Bacteroidia bacterium]|nr:hypothetical protein [Bacteroidia bacterium]